MHVGFSFLISSIEENIKFTAETTKADGSMPFLDTLVTPKSDGSLSTTVYRKPTHTRQYLQWDRHHAISNKYSVISSLLHRGKDILFQPRSTRRGTNTHTEGFISL